MSRVPICVQLPRQRADCDGKAVALRSALIFAIACLLAGAPPLVWSAPESAALEYRSKANFLARFPSFIEWPDSAFSSPQSPFLICVRGDFSFGMSLAQTAGGASSHGRRVEVRWVHKDEDLRTCHIAFVSRSESKRYAKVLQALEGTRVLTVGETDSFLSAGGAVSFSFEHDTLQFEVNLLASDTAHLRISSRLLALARHVVNRTEAAKS